MGRTGTALCSRTRDAIDKREGEGRHGAAEDCWHGQGGVELVGGLSMAWTAWIRLEGAPGGGEKLARGTCLLRFVQLLTLEVRVCCQPPPTFPMPPDNFRAGLESWASPAYPSPSWARWRRWRGAHGTAERKACPARGTAKLAPVGLESWQGTQG